jgi:isocitrate dehydrogenase kinase/phosphatase
LTQEAARQIDEEFESWFAEFRTLSSRQAVNFREQDWAGGARVSRERLAIYEQHIRRSLSMIRSILGAGMDERDAWAQVRGAFAALRQGRPNVELAETFFNSHTRRVFGTVGVDPYIEFVADALTVPQQMEADPAFVAFPVDDPAPEVFADILRSYDLGVPWQDLERDASRVAERVLAAIEPHGARLGLVEMLAPVLYRNKGAYLVGRIRAGEVLIPVVLPVLHSPAGYLRIDAALLTANEASQVFSFTRSYFHTDYEQPWGIIRFLKTLMPLKRIAELYISMGFVKHGKTELYRDLTAFLADTTERFERARGTRGMVMSVFTLPDYDIVFKLIKDRFDPVKQSTREEVRQKYRFVMMHDRVGRLADVQEYEHLEFPLERFDKTLVEELLEECPSTVHIEGNHLVVEHLYMERRVTPLNIYLQEVSGQPARETVIDAGYAIKDLAAANIFPGDMLIKNFGVTRHGRVIFYDYDELDHLHVFNFREKPEPPSEFEMMSGDTWFYVGPHDIFPEEIGRFMGFPAACAKIFNSYHADLMTATYWQGMQARHNDEEPVDLFPYPPEVRFPV